MSELAQAAGVSAAKAGSLDDRSDVVPTVEVWCVDRQSWVSLPGMAVSLDREWRRPCRVATERGSVGAQHGAASGPTRGHTCSVLRFRALSVVLVAAILSSSCAESNDTVRASQSSDVSTSEVSSSEVSTSDGAPAPAAGGIVVFEGGVVTDDALVAIVTGDTVDTQVADAVIAAFTALAEDEQIVAFADLSRRYELELAKVSGLQDAMGDPAAVEEAIDQAWALVGAQVDAIDPAAIMPTPAPSGFRRSSSPAPSATGVSYVGLMLATFGLSLMSDAVISSSNDFTADQYAEDSSMAGVSVAAGVEGAAMEMKYEGDQNGVAVSFTAKQQAIVCPDATGRFEASATIDLATSLGNTGTKSTFDLKVEGQVDDDANLASTNTTGRAQAADFAGGKGQYVDMTIGVTTGAGAGPMTYAVNRTGGTVTAQLTQMTILMQLMFQTFVGDKLVTAATKAWQSGRCVQLTVTPSAGPGGLDPSAEVTVTAAPKSKVDGAPAGGTVTATLTAGEASVSPSATKVPADATFTYLAPGEKDKTGVVSFESRSKRGVGKASINFDTKQAPPPTVRIAGPVTFSLMGLEGTALIDVTLTPDPDGVYSGTAEAQITGALNAMQTTCTSATWTESIDLMATLTTENDEQVLIISTVGEAPRGTPVPTKCTTAGIEVPSRSPLISSSLFGEVRIRAVNGDQDFVDTVATGTVVGTVAVSVS